MRSLLGLIEYVSSNVKFKDLEFLTLGVARVVTIEFYIDQLGFEFF